ncbi:MAG: V-type ATPase subunit subunit G family protein [Methanoregula sp.]|jgi:vacuolar-type H+-ATPase subunit H|uniref:V-type ATPase subunit subunit G family protein n=1 Tax=Methanoregula sp. TaxID=2052170 RepID=UPI003C1D0C15
MDSEKSLLQQIRDREQEFAIKIEAAKRETEAEIAAAYQQADTIITEAGKRRKAAAEALLHEETATTGAEVDRIKKEAAALAEAARKNGERHLPSAVEKITEFVTSL